MKKNTLRIVTILFILACLCWPGLFSPGKGAVHAQQPTISIPTVTSSPSGPMIRVKSGTDVEDQINVRAGPAYEYAKVGVLVAGQWAPALGRSVGGDWILVAYPGAPEGRGWVYSPLVDVYGDLPIVEPPATPTPRTTPTIDPTLAAQFLVEVPPTRLPTYTAPPPLAIPTFDAPTTSTGAAGIPMGIIIIGLGVIGLFGTFLAVLRGR